MYLVFMLFYRLESVTTLTLLWITNTAYQRLMRKVGA